MLISHRRQLNRRRTLSLLEDISVAQEPSASLYLPPGQPPEVIELLLAGTTGLEGPISELKESLASSSTGGVLFWGTSYRILILPPFPVAIQRSFAIYEIIPLRSLLQCDFLIALVIVRLGDYAIGVFAGDKLKSSKVGTGLVHSRHRKGGSSQRRFERHREKQIESFFARICGHAREQIEPYTAQLDHLIYGGERHTLLNFRHQCRFLAQFDDRAADTILNIRRPRRDDLDRAIESIWSSRVIQWSEG